MACIVWKLRVKILNHQQFCFFSQMHDLHHSPILQNKNLQTYSILHPAYKLQTVELPHRILKPINISLLRSPSSSSSMRQFPSLSLYVYLSICLPLSLSLSYYIPKYNLLLLDHPILLTHTHYGYNNNHIVTNIDFIS